MEAKTAGDRNEWSQHLAIRVLTPVMLAAAIFSVNKEALPFALTSNNLILAILLLVVLIQFLLFLMPILSPHVDSAKNSAMDWLKKGRVGGCLGAEDDSEDADGANKTDDGMARRRLGQKREDEDGDESYRMFRRRTLKPHDEENGFTALDKDNGPPKSIGTRSLTKNSSWDTATIAPSSP